MFIADLHLQVSKPATLDLARRFFTQFAPISPRLFILGDLVEYWIGDDAYDGSLDTAFGPLAALHAKGTRTSLMYGNRDFLIGHQFAEQFCTKLILEDHYVFESATSRILLMHGDTLCTDDTQYLQMREKLHDPDWQANFLAQSVQSRNAYALSLRNESQLQTQAKDQKIMDVSDDAVRSALEQTGATTLIHGHTHKPGRHEIMLGENPATRWVVGDWHAEEAVVGVLENGEFRLETYR